MCSNGLIIGWAQAGSLPSPVFVRRNGVTVLVFVPAVERPVVSRRDHPRVGGGVKEFRMGLVVVRHQVACAVAQVPLVYLNPLVSVRPVAPAVYCAEVIALPPMAAALSVLAGPVACEAVGWQVLQA